MAKPPAVVDMLWFSRGQEVQDRVAHVLTRYLEDALRVEYTPKGDLATLTKLPDITVVVRQVAKEDYYEVSDDDDDDDDKPFDFYQYEGVGHHKLIL